MTASSKLSTSAWRHLAVTYDGTTLRIFIDGVQLGSAAATGGVAVSNGALQIGGSSIWIDEWYSGLIDDVRIYDRAL